MEMGKEISKPQQQRIKTNAPTLRGAKWETKMRECGNCSLCCKLLPIAARSDGGNDDFPFDKPAGEWCKHCSPGNGCKVFGRPDLPSLCRNYRCAWLMGVLPEELKPSRVHAIFDQHEVGGMPYVLITTDPTYPVHPDVLRVIEQNCQIPMVLRTGDRDRTRGAGDTVEERQNNALALTAARRSKHNDMKAAGLLPACLIPVSAIGAAEASQ
jgi:hypothetical protein